MFQIHRGGGDFPSSFVALPGDTIKSVTPCNSLALRKPLPLLYFQYCMAHLSMRCWRILPVHLSGETNSAIVGGFPMDHFNSVTDSFVPGVSFRRWASSILTPRRFQKSGALWWLVVTRQEDIIWVGSTRKSGFMHHSSLPSGVPDWFGECCVRRGAVGLAGTRAQKCRNGHHRCLPSPWRQRK